MPKHFLLSPAGLKNLKLRASRITGCSRAAEKRGKLASDRSTSLGKFSKRLAMTNPMISVLRRRGSLTTTHWKGDETKYWWRQSTACRSSKWNCLKTERSKTPSLRSPQVRCLTRIISICGAGALRILCAVRVEGCRSGAGCRRARSGAAKRRHSDVRVRVAG